MQLTAHTAYSALATVERLPADLARYVAGVEPSPGLLARASASGLPANTAVTVCAVLTRVIKCLDDAGRMRKTSFGRAKLLETALEGCRAPVGDALRLGMVACPVDARAMLRLWSCVCEPHERGEMLRLLLPGDCNIS